VQDILIVEDDEQIRRLLSRTLTSKGYTVVTARNGLEALAELELDSTPPRVIIVDLMMPVMDGWRFRENLLRQPRWAKIPVIILSGSGCNESGGALAGVHYVAKPVSLKLLFDSVALALAVPHPPN
jgi:CheY-like chemotaxis protein